MRKFQRYIIQFWQLIIIVASTFIAVLYPFQLIFNYNNETAIWLSQYLVTAIFVFDIIYNLLYYGNAIFKNPDYEELKITDYLTTWFIVDLIAVFPVDILFNTLAAWSLLRLVKIIKAAYFISEFRKRTIKLSNFILLLTFIYWLLLIAHWVSCGWMKIGTYDFRLSHLTNYINAFYWSITTLTTVGYGDIIPITNAEKIYTMLVQIIGVGFYGFLIGNVASIFTKKDPAKTAYLANIEKLSMLVKYRSLPKSLQTRLRDYYNYEWKYQSGYSESILLGDIPSTLKNDIMLFLKKSVLEKITLFSDVSDEFIERIGNVLKPVTLTPQDVLIREGDESTGMYFIIHGRLSVFYENRKRKVAALKDGDYLGEYSLIKSVPRTATVISDSFSDLYFLGKEDFDKISEDFPEIQKRIEKKVLELEQNFEKK